MLFNTLLVVVVLTIASCNGELPEKILNATQPFNQTCLDIVKSPNTQSRCELYNCFEDRFPCGPEYWILRWGLRYCNKYSDPSVMKSFTIEAKRFLHLTNMCVSSQLEKIYKTSKPLKCATFYSKAFTMQSKCYAENQDLFCKMLPLNLAALNQITDMEDYMDPNFMEMFQGALAGCNPPIDLASLMASSMSG